MGLFVLAEKDKRFIHPVTDNISNISRMEKVMAVLLLKIGNEYGGDY